MRKNLFVFILICFVVIFSIAGGAFGGAAVMYLAMNNGWITSAISPADSVAAIQTSAPAVGTTVSQNHVIVSTTELETTITRTVAKVSPSVVTIVGTVSGQADFFGMTSEGQVSGSGVIISPQGYILTNNHVIEGTNSIVVELANGGQLQGKVVGSDKFADIAILKVDGQVPAVAALGNSDNLNSGETVIAIGSPLGDLKNTVTVGVVSATGRSLDTGDGYQLTDMIQTDAAINHGNSGGPLVNLAGEVIGINTLVVRSSGSSSDTAEGLGFAVPANTARAISDQIIQKGYFARPYLGIRYQWITPDIASVYNLSVEWGAYVAQMDQNSPASQAGIRRGDIITKVGDQTLDESHSYINTLFKHSPGEKVTLEVLRGKQTRQISVTLGESQ